MRGLMTRIALRALPVALLVGGVVVVFAYATAGALLMEENQPPARAVGWYIAGMVAGMSFLLLTLLEWLRWRREKLAPPGPPPAK